MKTLIRFIQPFTDGTIFDDTIKAGVELEVNENVLARVKSSGGEFEVLGRVIPPSTAKKKRKAPPKEQVIKGD